MRNLTKLILTTTLLFTGLGGVSSVKAADIYANLADVVANGDATWTLTESVYTFTWTDTEDSRNDYISFFAAFGGSTELDWSDGTNLIFTCAGPSSSTTNALDVIIMANGKKFSRAMYSDGTKTLTLTAKSGDGFKKDGWGDYITAEDLKHVTDIRLQATNKFEQTLTTGSVTISNMYVQISPKTSISFNALGVATLDLTKLDVSGNVTYDASTGVVTSTGEGAFFLSFENADFTNVKSITVNVTRDEPYKDICNTSNVIDATNGTLNTWYDSRYSINFESYQAKAGQITTLKWNVNSTGSMRINSITLTANPMQVSNPNSLIVAATYSKWTDATSSATISEAASPAWEIGHTTGTVYGDVNVYYLNYADLKDFKTMQIYVNNTSGIIRAMFNRVGDNGSYFNVQVDPSSNTVTGADYGSYSEGVFSINLAKILADKGMVHLNAIKAAAGASDAYVDKVILVPITENPYNYVLSGQYSSAIDISEATSDASATAIDCTNLSGNNVSISSANPNCLFVARAGVLSNPKNVIVGSTCANLVIADNYPFKAPSDFTATDASYSTTINTTAKAGTLCLPFAATIPEGVSAYTLKYSSGDKATAEEVTTGTISANTPVLLNGSGAASFTGANVEVDADATNEKYALTGVFESGTVPVGSYVLQNGDSGVGFYQVTTDDPITIKPFRAYLTSSGSGARSISIVYADESAGISDVNADGGEFGSSHSDVYDLQGRRVSQTTKGLYIVGGKKVIK